MEPAEQLKYILITGWAVMGVVWRTILRPAERTLKTMLVNLCVCIPLGFLAGNFAEWMWESKYVGWVAASAASCFAMELMAVVDKDFVIRMRDRIADKFTT